MTRRWRKPSGRRMRREPEEMGLTLAFPAAVPQATESDDPAAEPLRAETTDGELIQRVGRGDAGAFEVLYRRVARPGVGVGAGRPRGRVGGGGGGPGEVGAGWGGAPPDPPGRRPRAPPRLPGAP